MKQLAPAARGSRLFGGGGGAAVGVWEKLTKKKQRKNNETEFKLFYSLILTRTERTKVKERGGKGQMELWAALRSFAEITWRT